ncbi:hypothetical protein MMC09_005505 [Bachmanniomyces sp. S44760]|nr:hypothetical protein [Bachmanniomyces sp. S44760]
MSQYISSFLIEPVVRQARRFSRPGPDTESSTENTDVTRGDGHEESLASSQQEARSSPDVTDDGRGFVDSISGQRVVGSPGDENAGLDAVLHFSRDRGVSAPAFLQSDGAPNTTREGTHYPFDGRGARPPDEFISGSAIHEISDRLMSNTASFSSSIRSLVDVNMTPADAATRSRSSTEPDSNLADSSSISRALDGSLPADDGMGLKRKRIIDIQRTDKSSTEKARLIHELMTQEYSVSQSSLHAPNHARPLSPASLMSQDRPFTPGSGHSAHDATQTISPPTSVTSNNHDLDHSFHLSSGDLLPTYYTKPAPSALPAGSRKTKRPNHSAAAITVATSNSNVQPVTGGILVASATMKWKIIPSIGARRRTCFACSVDAPNLLEKNARIVGRGERGTIAGCVNCGMMIPRKASITVGIVAYVVLGRG